MKTYLWAALAAFGLSFLLCALLIPLLRKVKAGQNILSYVKEHKEKSGTPTMGGLAFILAASIVSLAFAPEIDRFTVATLAIGLSYMLVGLIDDLLKKKHKENLGLKAYQKLVFQLFVAVFAGVFAVRSERTVLYIPFTDLSFDIGLWSFPLTVFCFLATVNAVNLTDGLDGLAAGVSAPFFACLGVLSVLRAGETGAGILSFCLTGALVAYLVFNSPKASVFMGDTGSLSLGGFAAAIASFTGNALYILVIGLAFVFTVISVVLQVIYYKATGGKRIFLMSPAHHHFQQKGHSESKIAYAYFTVTLILGVLSIVAAL
ncbi:MAG: phospho-N-acetylmuramoyl-pentapeptide-transferase [Clostridia bacterium]|nr:phospho-N-acetylmuramoyl-pentapeptide-transferase [Clostridia bacterium]